MPKRPHRIEILTFPGAQLLDVTGPLQVFATANDLAPAGEPPYALALVAAEADPPTTSGFALRTGTLPREDDPIDTLIVSGGRGVNAACERPSLVEWVRMRSAQADRTASVCSGAFLLASAGLLDGKRAVTHWQRYAEFAARFPQVRLEADPIFIRDGTTWTSAGITAGIDLALAMVEADIDRKAALAVARQLVMFLKRPGGQAQFSKALSLQDGDGRFDRLHAWILENLQGDLSITGLAEQACISARSFSRHYRQVTGRTPARAVELLRVEAARHRLEDGATVSGTARRCGFGAEETMRRAFLRSLGVGPEAYRERFGHR
ncbi:GlxA family transcriptional regulator [Lichenifustis flavocetrariae]|uniref:Helix-turn-helix domain-containing protein n=1 Tax=Lichenifustis flavocetrariae TaxID=2949735 RepID=A0AA41Z3U9_9HYPH|nr:helix-turn-helix domain-containing protein [Lichenifustis flavocetrariae]MCW6512433.1 helix-turn-helix domain-containing protein [Lichenifustis flavocetrariae]